MSLDIIKLASKAINPPSETMRRILRVLNSNFLVSVRLLLPLLRSVGQLETSFRPSLFTYAGEGRRLEATPPGGGPAATKSVHYVFFDGGGDGVFC